MQPERAYPLRRGLEMGVHINTHVLGEPTVLTLFNGLPYIEFHGHSSPEKDPTKVGQRAREYLATQALMRLGRFPADSLRKPSAKAFPLF